MMRNVFTKAMLTGLIFFIGIYYVPPADAEEAPAANPAKTVNVPAAKAAQGAKPAEAAKSPAQQAEPSLKITSRGKGAATLELLNDIPVRALQFTIEGAKITEVRTTGRTKGYLAKFNEKNGMVIILSTAGEEIQPGKGAVAEIVCDKPSAATLKDVKIVGKTM